MPRGRGPSLKLGVGARPGRSKYVCNVEGCGAEIISYDLDKHYLKKANADELKRLRNCQNEKDKKVILSQANAHTVYLFENGFTETKLPSYKVGHRRAQSSEPSTSRLLPNISNWLVRQSQPAVVENVDPDDPSDGALSDNEPNTYESQIDDDGDHGHVWTGGDEEEEHEQRHGDEEEEHEQRHGDVQEEHEQRPGDVQEEHEQRHGDAEEEHGQRHGDVTEEHEQRHGHVAGEDEHRAGAAEGQRGAVPQPHEDINLSEDTIKKIAVAVLKNMKSSEKEEQLNADFKEFWITGDEHMICRPCSQFSHSLQVPKTLEKHRVSRYGIILRDQSDFHLKRSLKEHEEKGLHIWCVGKEKEEQTTQTNWAEQNKKAGEQVIRNLLHCLKRNGSSEDFVAMNNLNHLSPENDFNAVKNNSRNTYFELRECAWEVLTEDTQILFRDETQISNIAASLDKVTVFHISYTVTITYYFLEGKIFAIVNEVYAMDDVDYESEGTARMVVEILLRTLGISRSRLVSILRHFSYDGVYATTVQRKAGGGSLNLVDFVCRELGIPQGSISGAWDVSHLMEIVWNTTLTEEEDSLEVIEFYMSAMGEHRVGKSAVTFKNAANELGNLVLKNKNYQRTRFVRSLLRALRVLLQNLPTIVTMKAREFNEAAINFRNTEAKILKKELDELRDPKKLVKLFGIMELLELYAYTSVLSQSSHALPSQVWGKILETQEKLDSLSAEWKWQNTDLRLACMEAPTKMIDRLVEEQLYRPKVFECNVRNYRDLEDAGLLEDHEKISDLFLDDGDPIKPLAGEILMNPITTAEVAEIEGQLESLAEELVSTWRARQTHDELDRVTFKAFGSFHKVEDILRLDEDDSHRPSETNRYRIVQKYLEKLLTDIVVKLPENQRDKFHLQYATEGFRNFNFFWIGISTDKVVPVDKAYERWYKERVMDGSGDQAMMNKEFSKIFENVQIRSLSEAFCETVGSVMSNKVGNGRYLQPGNFSKEVCMEINLGPIHLLGSMVQKVLDKYNREYLYKRKASGAFATWNLKEYQLGAAIRNKRKDEEEKSRFPLSFWTK